MNFKKKLKEAAILVGAFLIAVVVFSYFTNKGNDDMTADMGISEEHTSEHQSRTPIAYGGLWV